jgi:hypothetical protein
MKQRYGRIINITSLVVGPLATLALTSCRRKAGLWYRPALVRELARATSPLMHRTRFLSRPI